MVIMGPSTSQYNTTPLYHIILFFTTTDFPRVWHHERTLDRDRKRMVRLLLEDVTLRKDEVLTAQVRFKGGATQTITLPISQGRRSAQEVLTLIDQLLDDYTDAEVAEHLNQRGWRTYEGKL